MIKKGLVMFTLGLVLLLVGCKEDDSKRNNEKLDTKVEKEEIDNESLSVLEELKSIVSDEVKFKGGCNYREELLDYSGENHITINDGNIERYYTTKDNSKGSIYYYDYVLSELEKKDYEDLTEEELYELEMPKEEVEPDYKLLYEGDCDRDNIMVIGNEVYFTEFKDNMTYLKKVADNGKDVIELGSIKADSKCLFIEDKYVCYIRDGKVYAYNILLKKEICISKVEHAEQFYICKYGIIVLCEKDELINEMYINDECVLKSEDTCVYDIEIVRGDTVSETCMYVSKYDSYKKAKEDENLNEDNRVITMDKVFAEPSNIVANSKIDE